MVQSGEFEQSLLEMNQDQRLKNMKRLWRKWNFLLHYRSIWQLVSRTNKYIDETKPWELAKEEEQIDELEVLWFI